MKRSFREKKKKTKSKEKRWLRKVRAFKKPRKARKKRSPHPRAEPIQFECPEFHGPENNPTVRQSQEALQYEHLKSINQLALATTSRKQLKCYVV